MKAIVCNQFGQPNTLQYQEVATPSPKEDEILISVKACSVNFPDTLIINFDLHFLFHLEVMLQVLYCKLASRDLHLK